MSSEAISAPRRRTAINGQIGRRIGDFFSDAVLQTRVWQKAYPGIMHGLIFWGVTIQIIGTAINLMQMQLFVPFVELGFPRGNLYLAYELMMDVAGFAILAGVLMAAFRRLVLRPATLETRWDDWYALGLLLTVALLGFTTEGLRIVATDPAWAMWSPGGRLTAGLMRAFGLSAAAAQNVHQWWFWAHMAVGLVFVASIPFTKLRHLIATPLNIVMRPLRKESAFAPIENIEEAEVLGVGQVAEFEPWQLLSFDACVRCGRCEEVCPAALSGMDLSPKAVVQSLRATMEMELIAPNGNHHETPLLDDLVEDAAWLCTTCGACVMTCPAYVNPPAAVVDLRRHQSLMLGNAPKSVAQAMRNLERQGNPWGMPASDRMGWAEGVDLRVLEPGETVDVLLYLGCALAYDDRNQAVARAVIDLLNAAEVDFGVLGDAEACCGETARRLGYEYNYQVLAEMNVETFGEFDFQRIVTPCPHCFNTLKNEYPQFGGDYEVQHLTQLLDEVRERLPASAVNGQTITFHDSCYLARYNDVMEEPRDLLDHAGVKRVEMDRRGAESFCCGGGGGQMWMETDSETRINQRRLDEALAAGADVIATACPYCLIMFDDAIRSTAAGDRVQVMDLTEILSGRLETETT